MLIVRLDIKMGAIIDRFIFYRFYNFSRYIVCINKCEEI